ncbi:Leucine-rich repeat receptor-like protein kinase PXL2 [Apostasia shenzhenica]|uniref:Leucine-rich repeat receptor-like protein kinase PXL2 n=1 Tax=Apostasia shenzhenica TaxID=1088818 RepID=A0A2H9ZRH5_9ASPA|nr:Leucine-rich repeat receptor-like protein kinase PXL2 [Apostasia shenzhenica]
MKVDEKSDIYSFGVVLMELVTGKRPVEAEFGEGEDVVGWVRARIRSNQPEEALDRTVWGQSSHVRNEMLLMLRIAVICTARSPRDRPTMRDVLTMMAEAKPCRKSSGDGGGKEMRPVFTPAPPDSDFI